MEFYEDAYERKPNLTLPGDDEEALDEEPELEPTGDPLMDEIEKRLAKGEDIEDLLDLMDPAGPAPGQNSLQRAETLLKTDDSFFSKEKPGQE